jgi:hypothetical protein
MKTILLNLTLIHFFISRSFLYLGDELVQLLGGLLQLLPL